jgi:hypothetical protein
MCNHHRAEAVQDLQAHQQHALEAEEDESTPEISREGTPAGDKRDSTFDYQQEAKLKSVSHSLSLGSSPFVDPCRTCPLNPLSLSLSSLLLLPLPQADSHFLAHQIRSSPLVHPTPSVPVSPLASTFSSALPPTTPHKPFSGPKSPEGGDAIDLAEELAEGKLNDGFVRFGLVDGQQEREDEAVEVDEAEDAEDARKDEEGYRKGRAESKENEGHQRGHSMHEGIASELEAL